MQQNQILSGGLWGRFAQSFCVLQGDLDAMERVLYHRADPSLRAELLPLLRDMACRLPSLERLANQTADIAIGSALRTVHRQDALDLAFLLEELAQDVNAELSHRGMNAAVELERQTDSVPIVGDSSLICAMLVNLLSNSLGARADARVSWTLTGTALLCRDDGPGLPEDAWRTLLENSRGAGWMDHGCTGLCSSGSMPTVSAGPSPVRRGPSALRCRDSRRTGRWNWPAAGETYPANRPVGCSAGNWTRWP